MAEIVKRTVKVEYEFECYDFEVEDKLESDRQIIAEIGEISSFEVEE